jgi:molybdopterin molybdotransferase
MTLDEAIAQALAHVEPITERERVPTLTASGRVLAEEILCPHDVPGFARAAMDGYAVRAADLAQASRDSPVTLRVIGAAAMGQDPRTLPTVGEGEALEISTGAPVPPGADAVVMVEQTARLSDHTVQIFSAVEVGAHVLAADSDFRRGELVFRAGHKLRAVDIGALLAMGISQIQALRRVRVGLISSGDELVEVGEPLRPGQVYQINGHILRQLVEAEGAVGELLGIVPDDPAKLRAAVEQAVRTYDMVLLSGGSSVGRQDWTFRIFQELGEVLVHGIAIKPGRPTIFALIEGKPVIGLPGNPVSCVLVCEKFVRPVLARRGGVSVLLPSHKLAAAQLMQTVRSTVGREDFIAVRVRYDGGKLYAIPVAGHSNNISTLARADGILRVPPELEEIPQGAQVWVELL